MTTLFTLFSVLQSLGISIGLGCSTVSFVYYFSGHHKDQPDSTRQRDTRIVYRLMRIALTIAFLSTVAVAIIFYLGTGGILMTTYSLAVWTFFFVLLLNAALMVTNIMPNVVGPLLQTSTWYALGIAVAVPSDYILDLSLFEILTVYVAFAGVVIIAANLYVAHRKGEL